MIDFTLIYGFVIAFSFFTIINNITHTLIDYIK